tara:strand:- start:240 stop:443 length:204 start_codon:yes stop_codon:yes gene_type:complete
MNFPIETLEQQKRSVAMLSPGASARVVLDLEREAAISVIQYAIDLGRIKRREPTKAFPAEDDSRRCA